MLHFEKTKCHISKKKKYIYACVQNIRDMNREKKLEFCHTSAKNVTLIVFLRDRSPFSETDSPDLRNIITGESASSDVQGSRSRNGDCQDDDRKESRGLDCDHNGK